MAKNATKWPLMIRAVYDSFGTGRHNGDATAKRVMDRIVSWLTAGLELSPALQEKLMDNINMRTRFKVEDPGAPITLSKSQLRYALQTNPEWFTLGLDGEDLPCETNANDVRKVDDLSHTFHTPLADLSHTFHNSFTHLSHTFHTELEQVAQHVASIVAVLHDLDAKCSSLSDPKVMRSNVMESNHGNMTPSNDDMISADASIPHEDERRALSSSSTHDDVAVEKEHEGKKHAPALTIYTKRDKKGNAVATGNLEVGSAKYRLVFQSFDTALDRLRATGLQGSEAWTSAINQSVGKSVSAMERGATGYARLTSSALFNADDSHGYKAPADACSIVLLQWEGDTVTQAVIINDDEHVLVPLKQHNHPNYTFFKGAVAA